METSRKSKTEWSAIQLPLELSPRVVHVVRIRLDIPFSDWNEMTQFLSAEEYQRAARFRFDGSRRRFIVCRATLRQLLGASCHVQPSTVPLTYGNHGKPELCHDMLETNLPQIEFNVSHSGELGLIAITLDSSVGIDVEEFNPKVKTNELAIRFFAPAEALELSKLVPEEQITGFYRGWTCKEAYIKATGRGLSLSLNSFCVTIDPNKPASLRHVDDKPDESERWTTQSLDVAENYAAAVMVAKPNCRIECWDWPST